MIAIAVLLVVFAFHLTGAILEGVGGLIAFPFKVAFRITLYIFFIARFVISRRAIPLPQRNLTRAGVAAFVLTFEIVVWNRLPINHAYYLALWLIAAVAGVYLVSGYRGSRGVVCDPMAVIWWSCGAACSAALLIYAPSATPLQRTMLQALAYAGAAACLLRVWLLLRPVAAARLPHPSTIPGMPMAGPASMRAAHAALGRRGQSSRPKFKT